MNQLAHFHIAGEHGEHLEPWFPAPEPKILTIFQLLLCKDSVAAMKGSSSNEYHQITVNNSQLNRALNGSERSIRLLAHTKSISLVLKTVFFSLFLGNATFPFSIINGNKIRALFIHRAGNRTAVLVRSHQPQFVVCRLLALAAYLEMMI